MSFKYKLLILLFCFNANASEDKYLIEITDFPTNYRVYKWNSGSSSVSHQGLATRQFPVLKFYIPNQFLVRGSDGKVIVKSTLENWRKSTPVGFGHPRTKRGVGYYPFIDESGKTHYVALKYMMKRQKVTIKQPNTRSVVQNEKPDSGFSSDKNTIRILDEGDFTEPKREDSDSKSKQSLSSSVRPKARPSDKEEPAKSSTIRTGGLMSQLDQIHNNPSKLSCSSNSGSAAHCMVCNCYYESRGEPQKGQIAVNRTVLARVLRNGFPGSACGVIWFKVKSRRSGKHVAAFSWTLQSNKNKRRNSTSVRSCVTSTKLAIEKGAWKYDHFYNPNIATPSWASKMINRRGKYDIGNHRFLDSGAGYKKDVKSRLARNEYVSIEGVR